MSKVPLRALVIALTLTVGFSNLREAQAQSEIDIYTGSWIPFLPDYNAGSIVVNGGGTVVQPNVFNDPQRDYGREVGIRGLHRFLPTRTMIEFDLNIAGVDSLGSNTTIADPDAATTVWLANLQGTNFLATPDGTAANFALDSDVLHYSEYIGLRDRFDLSSWGLGLFDVGFGFSHQGFQQDYSLLVTPIGGGLVGQYLEELDTDYVGAEIRSTFSKCLYNHMVMLDINIGIYDMDADYEGTSIFRTVNHVPSEIVRVTDSLKKTAATFDIGLRYESEFHGILVRPGITFTYLTDMAQIEHPQTITAASPATLTTTSAYILGINFEVML